MVWILRKFLIMHQVTIQIITSIFGEYELKRVWLKTLNLALIGRQPKVIIFCAFPLVFFRINTLSKNDIMKGTRMRNPVNKHQKAQMSFSKPFSPHDIFIIIFMP